MELANVFNEYSSKAGMHNGWKIQNSLFNTHKSSVQECLYVDKVFKVFVETADQTTPNYN